MINMLTDHAADHDDTRNKGSGRAPNCCGSNLKGITGISLQQTNPGDYPDYMITGC